MNLTIGLKSSQRTPDLTCSGDERLVNQLPDRASLMLLPLYFVTPS